MGADGCVGVQGACGTQKQGRQGVFRVSQGLVCALWPGKFPRASCVCGYGAYGFLWVWEGVCRFSWVYCGVGKRVKRKTRQKESQIVEKDLFCNVCTWRKKTRIMYRWSWRKYTIIGVNIGQARGTQVIFINSTNFCYTQLANNCKKKAKRASAKRANPTDLYSKKAKHENSKKTQRILSTIHCV